MGFSRDDRLDDHDFATAATAMRSQPATAFISWWRRQLQNLGKDEIWKRRNYVIHRGIAGIVHGWSIAVSSSISATLSGSYSLWTYPQAASSFLSGSVPMGPIASPAASPSVCLADLPGIDLLALCKALLDTLSMIVSEANQTFWI